MPARVLAIFSGFTITLAMDLNISPAAERRRWIIGWTLCIIVRKGFVSCATISKTLALYLCFGSLLETKMDRNGLIGVALHGILVVGECGVRNVFHEILHC